MLEQKRIFKSQQFSKLTSCVQLFTIGVGSVCVYRQLMLQTHYLRKQEDFQVMTVFKVDACSVIHHWCWSVCVHRQHMIQTHYVRTEEDFH